MAETLTSRAAQDVMYLVGCAVKGEIPNLTRVEDIDAAYSYAAQHKLSAAVSMALESAGHIDSRSGLTIANALKRKVLYEREYSQIEAELTRAGIWHMPLKGMVLKGYYPKPGMREMGDHDILFDADRAEGVRSIMEGLSYQTESFGCSNHDVYCKPPFLRFEMHRELFDPHPHEELYTYYSDIEKRLLGDGFEKHLSPEDCYLYLCAHEHKHYSGDGTGIRSLVDTYVYLQHTELDMDYVAAEAQKMGLAAFEEANRTLALRLFSGDELTEDDEEMLGYVSSSGVYGSIEHRVENEMSRLGLGKARYFLNRFFAPLDEKNKSHSAFVSDYPFFYKHKVLLPLLLFYRAFRIIFVQKGKFRSTMRAIRDTKRNADSSE